MRTSRFFSSLLLTVAFLVMGTLNTLAGDPGIPFNQNPDAAVNAQKPGSLLIYNIYTSSATAPATENTRLSITNTSDNRVVAVHLFMVDGTSCSPADSYICLTQNQTVSIRASDLDPGTMGYVVAVAVDANGWPVIHNFLIGDLYVKFASGHEANVGAEAIAARQIPTYNDALSEATIMLNSAQYDRLSNTISLSNIGSRVDGNDTLLIINRVSGNLGTGTDAIGSVAGILFNDAENAFSFSFSSNQCQTKFSITNAQPRTAPRFTTVVPSGRTGWMKFFNYTGDPLLGLAINFNAAAAASPTAFNQGHNLHKLRLTASSVLTIPVFPPSC